MLKRFLNFHLVAFGFSCVYALLAYCQLQTGNSVYASDLQAHVLFVLHPESSETAGYSLLHVLCGWFLSVSGLSGDNALVFAGGAMLVLLTATCYASLAVVYAYFRREHPEKNDWTLMGLTLAVFLISMLVLHPFYTKALYLGVFTPNPWHNPTYLFGRFFSILAFFQYLRLLKDPVGGVNWRGLALLMVSLTLSVWSKPSFLITFLPAAALVTGWAWWRRWLDLGQTLRVAAAFLPAVLVLVLLDHKIYAGGNASSKVVIAPGVGWGLYTPSIKLSVALGMAFPLYVSVIRGRTMSRPLLVATVNWAAAFLAFLLLAEAGSRAGHANFAWGYMSGMFFMYLFAIEEWFLRMTVPSRVLYWIGTLLFALHLISGVRYFVRLLGGGSYM